MSFDISHLSFSACSLPNREFEPVFRGTFGENQCRTVSKVGYFRHHEDPMNCQSCNTRIDYLYLTNCAHCGCTIEPAGAAELQPLPEVPPLESFQKQKTWKRRLVNLGYLFVSAIAFMISGAVVVWVGAAFIMNVLIDLFDPVQTPGEYCGFGMALGYLSILVGGFLGTMVGSAVAIKRPLYRA
jgi:hypothetical protein